MIRPDDLELFEELPGAFAAVRDAKARLVWCSRNWVRQWARLSGQSSEALRGQRYHDIMPKVAADERESLAMRVMELRHSIGYQSIWHGIRHASRAMPIDREAFGHDGVFVFARFVPGTNLDEGLRELDFLPPATFGDLAQLSGRELEILYYAAAGLSSAKIAAKLFRSTRTVDNHIASIHRQIGVHSRAELVTWFASRGLTGFTEEQWAIVVRRRREISPDEHDLRDDSAARAAPTGRLGGRPARLNPPDPSVSRS